VKLALCAEYVPKRLAWAMYGQVSALASTLCKSVGVSLRRFEPCTCHSTGTGP